MLWVLLVLPLALANPFAWDDDCGSSPYEDAGTPQKLAEKYIVGGWEAREHEFPWQVSLIKTGGSHSCGGFLVTPGHVITASHCVDGDTAGELEVVAGEHLRNTSNDNKQLLGVTEIIMHPNYGPGLANDAAVLVLAEDARISENVGTICAPTAGDDHIGINATVSGWGEDQVPPGGLTNELRFYNGPIMNNSECSGCLNGITDDMVCQGACGNNPGDSCQGDSGGPLCYKDEATGLWTIIGIVSWGSGCADQTPGVYSRVEDNLDWFTEVINSTRTG